MTMPNQAPVTSWQVTGQMETTQLGDTGQAVAGVRVFFRTGLGNTGSIFVPRASYAPDNVRGLISEAAAAADAIGQLTSDS